MTARFFSFLVILLAPSLAFQPARPPVRLSSSLLLSSFRSDMDQARAKVREGMDVFRKGDVNGSIALWDEAEALLPSLRPYLWQRGLSYYYADRFAEASKQFRDDVAVNPFDVEEIVWDAASQMRMGASFPLSNVMSLPPGKKDPRKIMSTVYRLFRSEGTEEELALAGSQGSSPSDEFYSLFYLGLFAEARNEPGKAAEYMKRAVRTRYATDFGRGDYMTSVARIHCLLRKWQ